MQNQNLTATSNQISIAGDGFDAIIITAQDNIYYQTKVTTNFDEMITSLATHLMEISLSFPDCLIEIVLNEHEAAHSIGLSIRGETSYMHFFDSNFKRIRFSTDIDTDFNSGINSLANLLKYEYRSYFENIPESRSNLQLVLYKAQKITLEDNLQDANDIVVNFRL